MPPRASARAEPVRAAGLDAALVAAIEDGRDLIVPDRHRAAALRLAWARRQLAAGQAVWSTPSIHTWEAWLTRQWREAAQRGATVPAQLLNASQERALWETVLARLAEGDDDDTSLAQHAGAMMLAAARAVQSGIDPARLAQAREESLLAAALQAVRDECQARGLLSLRLAGAPALAFLAQVRAPRIVGEMRLTALQATLAANCWPGEELLLVPAPHEAGAASSETGVAPNKAGLAPHDAGTAPTLVRATDLEQELAACAAWCRQRVEADPGARLLVLSACVEPSLSIQAAMLWRALATGSGLEEGAQGRWLAVEGGEPLLHQALAADALAALEVAGGREIGTAPLQALLRSPYPGLAGEAARLALAAWLGEAGLGRWPRGGLLEALRRAAGREAAAAPVSASAPAHAAAAAGGTARPGADALAAAAAALAHWLALAAAELDPAARLTATEWARRFTLVLDGAGFARAAPLDSREQQRLARWNELLDEFAGLDAVLPPMRLPAALARLRRLATQARHQAATADAAITLSATLADPVAGYDGIWVLGLTESRWPAAPRPDAWVPLVEQRRAHWPESGVPQRREQAAWALASWQRCGTELVLSHPACEGDLVHRPTALVEAPDGWPDCTTTPPLPAMAQGQAASDQQLAPLVPAAAPLKGGTARLASQQACAFRAQAQWRLGAAPAAMLSGGVPASLRGRLLHLLLQHLWEALRDQAALLALDAAAQAQLIAHCWDIAVQDTPAARWLPAQALARERERALRTVERVLALERTRPAFTVEQREAATQWQGAGARVSLRIDRIDHVDGEAVLLDYKSGAPAKIQLHEDALQPLQLVVYAAALAQQGRPVRAAALLNLHPADPAFAGVAAHAGLLGPGLRPVEQWDQSLQHWQQQLVELMEQHLAGTATLTLDRRVCARCHLPALCRRAGVDVEEADDE